MHAPHTARLRVTLLSSVLALAAASAAGAQRTSPSGIVRLAGDPAVAPATAVAARDSAVKYLHQGQARRWTGASLAVAAVGAIAVAYTQYAQSARMGMDGAQGSTFAAGALVGALGLGRWQASRESFRTAARWDAMAAPTRSPSTAP